MATPAHENEESSFVHLHVHSSFSFEDGITGIESLLERADKLKMPALALTDHNTLAGGIPFMIRAKQLGIRPILGCELDLEEGGHLILLMKDWSGYQNVCRLLTKTLVSSKEEPRVTRELLGEHSQGLIALSGFRCGEISQLVRNYHDDKAIAAVKFYREIFGDGFYLEVCRELRSGGETPLRRLIAFARQAQVPLVATNAVHYLDSEDAATAALRKAIAQQTPLRHFLSNSSDRFLASNESMVQLFKDLPEALVATRHISDQCNLSWPPSSWQFKDAAELDGTASDERLTRLTYQTAAERCSNMNRAVCHRLEEELAVIREMGLAHVFLMAHELAASCREKGIRIQLRGSGVNSQILFALGVSSVEPMNHNLMFERFLHPDKQELPDLDFDVQRSRRDEVRHLLVERSGSHRVATLGAISTYNARSLLVDAAPVLGLPKDAVFGALEGSYGQRLKDLLLTGEDLNPKLRENRLLRHPKVRRALESCVGLDGLPHAISAHPSGVVIAEIDLTGLVPLRKHKDAQIITQFPAEALGELGIIKLDLLSSPTLDVLEEARSLTGTSPCGKDERNDANVFALHRTGGTTGCFQIETALQRELADRVEPETFQDVVVLLALGRPGPMRARLHEEYIRRRNEPGLGFEDPMGLKDCLEETCGILLYQEQALEIPHRIANFSYVDADGLYQLLTHPKGSEGKLLAYQERFLSGAIDNSFDPDTALAMWRNLTQIAGYSFPKGHATAYAGLAYEALRLKHYYPLEFLCALLNHQPCGSYPVRVLVMEARHLGIGLAPLDINVSAIKWTVEQGNLRVGLSQLKGMTDSSLRRILLARKERYFESLDDFVARTWLPGYLIENLVLVGALDSLEGERGQTLEELSMILRRRRKGGRSTLGFPGARSSVAIQTTYCRRDKMIWEFGLLGFCSTATLYDLLRDEITELVPLELLGTNEPGERVCVAGSVVRRHISQTRTGQPMRFFTIEDGTGLGNVVMFSDAQTKSTGSLKKASWLMVAGTVQERGPGGRSILASQVEPL